MRKLVLAGALTALAVVAGCAGGPGAAGSSSGSAAAASTAASAIASSSQAPVETGPVTISLDYNAGTGYEWSYAAEPEGAVELTRRETKDLAEGESITGGALQERFTFRAVQPGEVALTFTLSRSWEGDSESDEKQVYAFTIDDDLNMVLNPYKSEFTNEPEWGE